MRNMSNYPRRPAVFQREWFQFWSELPSGVWFVQSWDFTFGARRNSWVVGQLWATDGGRYYFVDQTREQTDSRH